MWLHFVKKTSGEVETLGVMIRAQLGNLKNLPQLPFVKNINNINTQQDIYDTYQTETKHQPNKNIHDQSKNSFPSQTNYNNDDYFKEFEV